MRITILFLAISLFLISCKQTNKENIKQTEQLFGVTDSIKVETLPPLQENELSITEEEFGEIIKLKGTSHPVEHFFKVSETQMIATNNILIVKNRNNSELFMAFSLPDFKFIKSFGKFGRGPNEFQYPSLVKTENDEVLCYVYERTNDKLYSLNREFEISELPLKLPKSDRKFNDKQFQCLSTNEFFYVESIKMGKAIFHLKSENDSTSTTLIKNLAFSDNHKNWAAYIGDFGANGKNKRLVFAYKYFKRIIFSDLENKTSRIISFDLGTAKRGSAKSIIDPSNVTHYWGMSAQNKYLYVLYSGRTPIDVTKELNETSGYIYVEQFDWNGNPIRKFKLDHWGYFCVNDKENTILLASTTDEHLFVSYELPVDLRTYRDDRDDK